MDGINKKLLTGQNKEDEMARFKEGYGIKVNSIRISKTLWLNTVIVLDCSDDENNKIQFQSYKKLRKKDIELKIID